jgi:hypothetical protein
MYFSPVLIVGLLLAGAQDVLGGSRLWEANAPNKRTNPSPNYPALGTLNTTSALARRAMSISDKSNDNSLPRIWSNKKMRYCFEDKTPGAVIRGLFEQAIEGWAALKEKGFTYEAVSDDVCESQQSSVLRIHYNSQGRLASTLGIPPIDEEANAKDPDTAIYGPYMHLSDMEGIGQDDVNANVAHELGHAWGLLHEHQNPYRWKASIDDMMNGWNLPQRLDNTHEFLAGSFNCRNLKDFDTNAASVQAKIDAATGKKKQDLQDDLSRRCFSQVAAQRIGFSASEWLPLANTNNLVLDGEFDRDSLMMYPSGAGGTGSSDNRAQILTYKDGSAIENRLTPSNMDIERLITLYGNAASAPPGLPHNSKSSGLKNKFTRLRSKASGFFRAGDTSAGLC